MTTNAAPEPWRDDDTDDASAPASRPDAGADPDRGRRPEPRSPFAPTRRSRWPRIDWTSVVAVVTGGFIGGVARYAVGRAWSAPSGTFPWGVWTVNTAGAFILALILVLVLEVLPPTRYVRAVVGTGFCGALTTFSSVATGADRLLAHGHVDVAVGYLVASVAAGLAAASFGVVVGRSIAAHREKGPE